MKVSNYLWKQALQIPKYLTTTVLYLGLENVGKITEGDICRL